MKRLPNFDLGDYAQLLNDLRDRGYVSAKVSEMCESARGFVVYLRHDVDFSLLDVMPMAETEARADCAATYYLLLSGQYNLHASENREAVKQLILWGHEIGLHYDLEAYPGTREEAYSTLVYEATVLERLCGCSIRTIVMHNPHRGQDDWFRSCDEYVHPHDPRWQAGLTYISESCRAWRDETLLQCFGHTPPRRLLLLTHPEVWLDGSVYDRQEYLERVLLRQAKDRDSNFYLNVVAQAWRNHAGAKAHDLRQKEHCS
jgi:hypothetical protein